MRSLADLRWELWRRPLIYGESCSDQPSALLKQLVLSIKPPQLPGSQELHFPTVNVPLICSILGDCKHSDFALGPPTVLPP